MKSYKYLASVIASALLLSGAQAQTKKIDDSVIGTLTYSGTRLTYPLVEGWIKEFNKKYPKITISVLPEKGTTSADLKVLAYTLAESEIKADEEYIVASNYAQLPISNSSNPALKEWSKTGLKESDLKHLYFKTDSTTSSNSHNKVTIYNRGRAVCAAKSFASHYGTSFSQSNGIGVNGDDRTLIEATKKDPNGITYNNLGFIYDLSTRKVIDGITVIPIDINENGKLDPEEDIYSNLDQLVGKLETGNVSAITVDKVNIVYKKEKNAALALFLDFVKSPACQKLNHQYGFLSPDTDKQIVAFQKKKSLTNK
jgi:phosphate transport system substrate-binding protein